MGKTAITGKVVTDYEVWDEGCVLLEDGAILDVSPDGAALTAEADQVHACPDSFISPGFLDLQINGAFGVDVATAPEKLPRLSESLLSTGTTAYLPTVITSPETLYERTLPALAAGIDAPRTGAAPLGVHLEGPFINPEKKGAHPAGNISSPNAAYLERLMELAPTRMLTLAPELDGSPSLMELAKNRGVVVSAGHSDASFEVAYDALDRSVAGVTHLFNAMSGIHHRDPGLPGAAFAHPRAVCGVIADGVHVHPEITSLAFRMLGPDRLFLVTDAISAAGSGDGEYSLATRKVYVEDGVPRLGSGAIAGSVLAMNEALKNILAFTGCTMAEAVRMASSTPARLVGESRRKGRLVPGYDADVVVLAPDLSVESAWVAGRLSYSNERTTR